MGEGASLWGINSQASGDRGSAHPDSKARLIEQTFPSTILEEDVLPLSRLTHCNISFPLFFYIFKCALVSGYKKGFDSKQCCQFPFRLVIEKSNEVLRIPNRLLNIAASFN